MEEYGVTFWLAPGVNIHRNPLCGRNYEYYSEDPVLSGKCAAAISRGIQSHPGCYVTIKHFAANNQETQRNRMSSNMDERTLREIYLEGFRIAVREGGAKAVMTSYNKLNHVYTPNSYDLCTKALRQEWGFDGVVMTDWMSTDKGLADRAEAYISGNDLLMPGGNGCVKEVKKAGQKAEESLFSVHLKYGVSFPPFPGWRSSWLHSLYNKALEELGISTTALWRKMNKYGIESKYGMD